MLRYIANQVWFSTQASGEILQSLQEKLLAQQKDAHAETAAPTHAETLSSQPVEPSGISHLSKPQEAMRAIDAGALKAAILDLSEGSSVGALAALEGATCARYGVQSFASLGHAPTLLQVS